MSPASARASSRSDDLPAPGSPATSRAPLRRSRAASSSALTRSCSPSRPYSMNPSKQRAEPVSRALDEDTLARRRRVLGEDHRDTLRSAKNLAADMRALGEAG